MNKYPDLPIDTLLIGRSHSHCNACGKECLPDETNHDIVAGYGQKTEGCGIRWRYVFSTYTGEASERAVQNMRPDLEYIPHPDYTTND